MISRALKGSLGRRGRSVTEIVETTRAIRGWIDGRIEAGWTNEQIEANLPLAASFIAGHVSEAELIGLIEVTRT